MILRKLLMLEITHHATRSDKARIHTVRGGQAGRANPYS